jgi:hypothetical protein
MTTTGDRLTTMLAREFARSGIRVLAITTGSSIVAGLAANELGADLAFAPGFGTLDAPVEPTMILGDYGLHTGDSPVGPLSDTFVAVARGLVGVVTTPAQLDGRGAANLSRIGGTTPPRSPFRAAGAFPRTTTATARSGTSSPTTPPGRSFRRSISCPARRRSGSAVGG